MTRIKGLDGIRMVAVIAVMISHFFESSSHIYKLHLGHFGVMLFFILSGFLISSIILKQKEAGIPVPQFLKHFYIRRTLRIFPLFYLALLVFNCFGRGFGASIWWHIPYASNFLLAKEGGGFLGTHFWSLAVEEQFYLIFPLLLYLCKPRRESLMIIGLIWIGAVSRIAFWNIDGLNTNLDRMLTTNLDCLGFGAVLALSKIRGFSTTPTIFFCGLYISTALIFGNTLTQQHAILVSLFVGCIAWVDRNQNARIIQLLEFSPIRYIGKISYGLYVWHYLLWQNKALFQPLYELVEAANPILQFGHSERIVIGALSFALAVTSWEFFEKQILTYKHRFSYS